MTATTMKGTGSSQLVRQMGVRLRRVAEANRRLLSQDSSGPPPGDSASPIDRLISQGLECLLTEEYEELVQDPLVGQQKWYAEDPILSPLLAAMRLAEIRGDIGASINARRTYARAHLVRQLTSDARPADLPRPDERTTIEALLTLYRSDRDGAGTAEAVRAMIRRGPLDPLKTLADRVASDLHILLERALLERAETELLTGLDRAQLVRAASVGRECASILPRRDVDSLHLRLRSLIGGT